MRPNGKRSLNARQEQFCKLFVANGIAAEAYQQAGYRTSGKSLEVCPYRLLGSARIKERISQLQAQKDARLAKKQMSKDGLMETLWGITQDAEAKRGEIVAASIALAKMVGWNAPTRVEHDLGDRVRTYLEDIRSRPLKPVMTRRYDSRLVDRSEDSEVIDVQPDTP
jgi:phage terminase small subunit